MKVVMSSVKSRSRLCKPIVAFLGSIMWASYSSAAEPEPLPDFDCVIEPSVIADLGSAVPGVIDEILAERSDSIKKGEIVATLESSVASANMVLSQARAELDTSISLRKESAAFGNRTSERNHVLYEKAAISKQEIDKLDTENRIAQLQVRQERDNKRIAGLTYDRAKAVLDRHLIRSPIEGVVMERFKSVGEYVEDDPIMRIAQIDPLHVEVILPVKYMGRLAPGRRAEVTPNVPGYLPYMATVTRVDRVADAASGTFGVRLSLPNADHAIPGGLRCSLTFLPAEETDLLLGVDLVTGNDYSDYATPSALPAEPTPVLPPEEILAEEMLAEEMLARDMIVAEISAELESEEWIAEERPFTEMTRSRDCYRVGPLSNEIMTASLSDTISGLDSASEPLLDVQSNGMTGYRVFVTFQPDEGAPGDLESYLIDNGVEDFFRISSGEHKGRISVGFFGSESNAMSYQESLAAMGIEAELSAVHLETFWINLSFSSDQESQIELESLVKSFAPAASVQLTQCSQQQLSRLR